MSFTATVHTGYLHNQQEGTTRTSQWIMARDIPLFMLPKYGRPAQNPRHPHNVDSLAWDLSTGEWRVTRNASSWRREVLEVQEAAGVFHL